MDHGGACTMSNKTSQNHVIPRETVMKTDLVWPLSLKQDRRLIVHEWLITKITSGRQVRWQRYTQGWPPGISLHSANRRCWTRVAWVCSHQSRCFLVMGDQRGVLGGMTSSVRQKVASFFVRPGSDEYRWDAVCHGVEENRKIEK